MPRSLPFIPVGEKITNAKDGTITTFFRLRWQELSDGYQNTASIAAFKNDTPLAAALAPLSVHTVLNQGKYRLSYYLRKTRIDGVASSLTVTFSWVDTDGQALTFTFAALATDTIGSVQSDSKILRSTSASDLVAQVAYVSNTPGNMTYDFEVTVEYIP